MPSETVFSIKTSSPEETARFGVIIGTLAEAGDVLLLSGNLGAGKTCLTQGIAKGLGITDYVMSPTFVLVRELKGKLPLYHMDLYRLDNLNEIDDLGLDDYFYGKGLSVVEWADKAFGILPDEGIFININHESGDERSISLKAKGERAQALISSIKETYKKEGGG